MIGVRMRMEGAADAARGKGCGRRRRVLGGGGKRGASRHCGGGEQEGKDAFCASGCDTRWERERQRGKAGHVGHQRVPRLLRKERLPGELQIAMVGC